LLQIFHSIARSVIVRNSVPLIPMAAILAIACGGQDPSAGAPSGPPPAVVETVVVVAEEVHDKVELVGQLDAVYSVVLKPEISGVVASIDFEEGKPVKKGVALVHLRDREQRARLREAEANVALARTRSQRAQLLAERNAESAAALESAQAELEIARARLDLAKLELERTVLRAPFDGVTGARMVSPGERVNPGGDRRFGEGGGGPSGLVRIDSLDQMELVFTVPETVMGLVSKGVVVALRVAPFPGETFKGRVYFVDPRVNATSRRVLVKARIPNPDHKLRPGIFAKLDVEVDSRAEALMVPEDSVVYGRDGTFVWRVVDERAERVPVELGIRQPGRVELRSGVRAGDRIVSAGTHKVRDGSRVRGVASRPVDSDTSGS
jgi:membrane fusion protein (multidrug efflux system)